MVRRSRRLSAAFLLIAAAATCFAGDTAGPLKTQNAFLPHVFFLQPSSQSARLRPTGEIWLHVAESYANTCVAGILYEDGLEQIIGTVDSEAAYTEIGLTWTAHPRLGVAVRVLHVAHFGGFLDHAIDGFHRAVGIDRGSRSRLPCRQVAMWMPSPNASTFRVDGPLSGLQSATIDLLVPIASIENGATAFSVEHSLKMPLVRSGFRRSGPDFLSRALVHVQALGVAVDAAAGVAYLSKPDAAPPSGFSSWVVPFEISAEYTTPRNLHPTLTIAGMGSPYALGWPRTDRFHARLSLGASVFAAPGLVVQLSVSEEFFTFAATDVAFNATIRYRGR